MNDNDKNPDNKYKNLRDEEEANELDIANIPLARVNKIYFKCFFFIYYIKIIYM